MVEFAAILASVILFGLAVFQIMLILDAPIGKFAWGGAHEVLPSRLKVASAFSVFAYFIFVLIILTKTELLSLLSNNDLIGKACWALTIYFFTGVVINGISRSKSERLVMTPVAAVLALLFLYISIA